MPASATCLSPIATTAPGAPPPDLGTLPAVEETPGVARDIAISTGGRHKVGPLEVMGKHTVLRRLGQDITRHYTRRLLAGCVAGVERSPLGSQKHLLLGVARLASRNRNA